MAYPTANQMDKAREIVAQHGEPDRLFFLNNAYDETVLAAYGLVFMEYNFSSGAEPPQWTIILRPDGKELDFDPRITVNG